MKSKCEYGHVSLNEKNVNMTQRSVFRILETQLFAEMEAVG